MATTKVSTKLLETVGVAEGGTGATSTSAARTSLGLVIGTNVLAPNGSGSSLTGIATGATDAEAANIMLNAFRISVVGSLTKVRLRMRPIAVVVIYMSQQTILLPKTVGILEPAPGLVVRQYLTKHG